MAELPELEYLLKVFERELPGKRIVEAECLIPEQLTMILDGDFAERLTGLKITKIRRRGPFLLLRTNGEERIVVNPADEGHFKFPGLGTRRPRTLVFVMHMEGGPRLWFLDNAKTAMAYLTSKNRLDEVPMLMTQGIDPFGKNFSPERFRRLLRKDQDSTLRTLLTDQTKISHIGPIYLDEILFDAGIHPAAKPADLADDDLDRLFDSVLNVLESACETIEERGQPIENCVRDFLKMHGRLGEPCRRCGGKIKTLKVEAEKAFYCSRCQPRRSASR
ncbi:MAG: Formamidopyrimidine-DNA glycosylase [candidate division BRC1 bacterium ADurb.BinA364]|nr:MAG: Formamidopyrimidine-DNA glycosylase [candidate division BRC1 bacterium ADurb.BinA364]